MKLPPATDIMAACEAAGMPRALDTVRNWTCGRRCPPVWVPVVVAEYICPQDKIRIAGEIAAELTRRWEVKNGYPDKRTYLEKLQLGDQP